MNKRILLLWFSLSSFLSPFACLGNGRNLNRQIGVQDTVLTPWTPMTVSSDKDKIVISCWGRDYIFNQSLLPTQIISQHDSLLSEPVKLNLTYNDKIIPLSQVLITITKRSKTVVELEGTASVFIDNYSEITVKSKIHIEYDGLMLVSLFVVYPNKQNPIYSLSINIPFNNKYAKYYMKWVKNYHNKYSGDIPNGSGEVLASHYTPYFWIGDNYRGLFWFCETTANWPMANENDAIKITRKNGHVNQFLNIGVTKQYSFGLQATPVKPLPKNWRKWRLMPSTSIRRKVDKEGNNNIKLRSGDNFIIQFPNPGYGKSVKYYGFPLATNELMYTKMIKRYHEQGYKFIPYAAITRVSGSIPNSLFKRNSFIKSNHKMKLKNGALAYINPNSPGYSDYIAKKFTYFLDKYNLDGYYLDGEKLLPYWKDSLNRPYFPILAYRNLQRELYAHIKKSNPDAVIVVHMSANMDIPVLAYADAYLDGEQFRYSKNGKLAYKVDSSYLNVVSLDQFKSEFMGKQWGLVPFFLPEVAPKDRNNIQPTLSLATLLLLHDVLPRPVASNFKVWNKMFQQLDEFDCINSLFIPYFDSIPPASTMTKGVYISAFRKHNGQSLIVVGNLSKQEKTCEIQLNFKRLGLKSIHSISNLTDNTEINYKGNRVKLSLDKMSYKLLWIK